MNTPASTSPDRPRWWLFAGGAAVLLVIGGVVGGLIGAGTDSSSSSTNENACPATSVANRVLPSVVTISARGTTAGGRGQVRPSAATATS